MSMSMSVKAWPFLVSRNQSLDYRTIVAPDFICDAHKTHLITKIADGDLTLENHAFFRQSQWSGVGNFTIVFRVIKAKNKDIEQYPLDEPLKDSFGREIYLIEGFFLTENLNFSESCYALKKSHLEQAHQHLKENYKYFWNNSNTNPIPSTAFFLEENESSPNLKLEVLDTISVINPKESDKKEHLNLPNRSSVLFNYFLLGTICFISIALICNIIGGILSQPCNNKINQPISIELNQDTNITKQLQDWQKKHQGEKILLTGTLSVEYLDLKYSNQIKEVLRTTRDRKKPDQGTLELDLLNEKLIIKDYPLDLAIKILNKIDKPDQRKIRSDNDIKAKIIGSKC